MQRFVTVVRYLLIVPLVLATLFGTLLLDGYFSNELLGRCPPKVFRPALDSDPPRCEDARLKTAYYLGLFTSHILAVTVTVCLAVFLAPIRKFEAALYAVLFGTWPVLLLTVLISDFDGFEYSDQAMLTQQLVTVLWAGICVYLTKRGYGAEAFPSEYEGVILGLITAILIVPYLFVIGIYF